MTDFTSLKNKTGMLLISAIRMLVLMLAVVARIEAQNESAPVNSNRLDKVGNRRAPGAVVPPAAGVTAPVNDSPAQTPDILEWGDNPRPGVPRWTPDGPDGLNMAPNPDLILRCPTDIILIIDESGSIAGHANGASNIAPQVRAGSYSFAQAFIGTNTRVAIVEFSTAAQLAVIGGKTGFQQVTNNFLTDLENYLYPIKNNNNDADAYDPEDYAGFTNWQAAFDVAGSLIGNGNPNPPLVVFFTDGEPTVPFNDPVGAAITAADLLKAAGAHLFMVAINNPQVTIANVEAVTDGANSQAYNSQTSDLSKADFVVLDDNASPGTFAGTLHDAFNNLAGALCQVDVSLTKAINNAKPAVGQVVTFTLKLSNAGSADMPATGLSVADYLPPGFEYKAGTMGFDAMGTGAMIIPVESSTPVLIWTIDQLDPGETVKLTFKANVLSGNQANGDYLNRAEVIELDQADVDSDVAYSFNKDDKDDTLADDDEAQVDANPVSCSAFMVTVVATGVPCYGQEAGSLKFTMTGGTPAYEIIWDGPASHDGLNKGIGSPHKITGYIAGTYALTVTDNKGCSVILSATITQPPPLTLVPTIANGFCSGGAADAIDLSVTGGTGPYTYLWSTGATTQDILNLSSGQYCVTVTDAQGCTGDSCVTVTQPSQVLASVNGVISCNTPVLTLEGNVSPAGPGIDYQWTTPDGNITSGVNTLQPTVNQAGTYILVVTDQLTGCTRTASVTVTGDQGIPLANAGAPRLITCVDTLPQLQGSGSSGAGYSVEWTANPGLIVSGANTFTPVVGQPGAYTLLVTNLNNGCSTSSTVIVGVDQTPPAANAGTDLALSCTNKTIQLQGSGNSGPGIAVQWTAIPGSILFGANTYSPTVDKTGKYALRVTNTVNGCSSESTVNVLGNYFAPVVTVAPPGVITCTDTLVELSAGATSLGMGLTYLWNTPTGNIVSGGNTPNPVVNKGGVYTLSVTNISSGCTTTVTTTVLQNTAPPVVHAGAGAMLNCQIAQLHLNGFITGGTNLTYQWQTVGGHIVSGANSLHPLIDSAGTYTLVATNGQNNCSAQSSVVIGADFNKPIANAGADLQLTCVNTTVTLDGSGSSAGSGFSYTWVANPGSILSGANTLNSAAVNGAGQYTLVVVNTANGCSATDVTAVIDLISHPKAVVAPAPPLTCISGPVQLNAGGSTQGGNLQHAWTTANGHIVSGQGTLSPTVDRAGTYLFSVTNPNNGCADTAAVTVLQDTVAPKAVAVPSVPLTCLSTQLQLNGAGSSLGGDMTYLWTTANGHLAGGQTTLTPTVDQPGTYTLTVENAGNGCTAAASVIVSELKVIPTANAGTAQTLTCSAKQFALNGSGSSLGAAFAYIWTTNDGNIVSGKNTLAPVINAPGTYLLTVVHKQSGCTTAAAVTVDQNITPPAATVAPAGLLTCAVTSVSLDGTGSGAGPGFTYLWSGPPGAVMAGQGTLNPVVNIAGVYRLVVTNGQNGCTASATTTVGNDVGVPPAKAATPGVLNCVVSQRTLDGTGSGTGPDFTYFWSGPGIVSGSNTLMPVVNAPGIYKLLVTDVTNGCTALASVLVEDDLVKPLAEAGPTGMLNCSVLSLDIDGSSSSSGPEFTYQWTASGGGNIVSGNNSLKPVIDRPGIYTLVVTNTVNGCTASDAVTVSEDKTPPQAAAAAAGMLTCANATVTLAGSGSSGPEFALHWSTTTGSIVSGGNTFNPVVDAPGAYRLVVTNTTNHCTASAAVQVDKDVSVPVAMIQAPAGLNCAVHVVQLDGMASSTGAAIQHTWSTAGGHFQTGTNTLTPTVDAPGQYTLQVLNTFNNCSAQFTVQVEMDLAPPVADAGAPDVISCAVPVQTLDGGGSSQGPDYRYQWSAAFGGHLLDGGNTLWPMADRSGLYTLVVTNMQNGCSANADVLLLLDMNSPQAEAGPGMTLTCTTGSVNLLGAGFNPNYTYQWTASAGGNLVSGADGLQPLVDAPGNYTLVVANPANGCTTVDSVQVALDITPPQALIATPPQLDCQTLLAALNTGGSSTGPVFAYSWTTADGHILSGAKSPAPAVDQPGTYQVLITNTQNGCTATASTTVQRDTLTPLADVAPAAQLNCGIPTLALNGSAANTGAHPEYTWTTAGGNILSGANTLHPLVDAAGIYELTVNNPDNHCSATVQTMVLKDITLPLAAIGAPSSLSCAVQEINLYANGSSAGPLFTYAWTAQNGGHLVSGADTPAPLVDAAGDYLLTVTNTANQCTATASATVTLDADPPVADAGSLAMLNCTAITFQLDGAGSSTGADFQYQWTTQDGLIVSGENTLQPSIAAPGIYTLIVTNTMNGCTMSASVTADQDIAQPQATAATPGLLTCQIFSVTLDGTGSSTVGSFDYAWSTSGGQISAGDTTLTPTVTAPGDYTLVVTNTQNGCSAQALVSVFQNIEPPTVVTNLSDTLNCLITQTTLISSGASSSGKDLAYAWSTSDGVIDSGGDGPEPVVSAGGLYALTVTDTYNSCTATAEIQVPEDVETPPAAIAPPALLNCQVHAVTLDAGASAQGSVFIYAWSGPSVISGGKTLNPVVNLPGQYELLVLNNSTGCSSTARVNVLLDDQPPVADAGAPLELTCIVDEGYLNAKASSTGPDFTYLWSTADGNFLSDPTEMAVLTNATGVYFLRVTNTQNGCTATSLTLVSQNSDSPTGLQMLTDPPGCEGQPGMVRIEQVQGGTGPYLYSIDGGFTFGTSSQFNQLSPGQYQLVVQDLNGCEYEEPLFFPELTKPNVQLGPDMTLAFGDSTTLTAHIDVPFSDIDSVIWSPADQVIRTKDPYTVIVKPFAGIVYTVTVVNKYGCEDRSSIVVQIGDPRLWAPNAISSNDEDGDNDVFLLFAAENTVKTIRSMRICDRWGNMVFRKDDLQPNDEKLGWNGFFRGKPVNPAVFVWWADVELMSGQRVLMKGDLTVVR